MTDMDVEETQAVDSIGTEEPLSEDEERHRELFDALVAQESDMFGASGVWPADDDGKRTMIAEIQDLSITFFLARLQRYAETVGVPQKVTFKIQVLVDGEPRAETPDIHVPEKKLILP
jgi:hypothetical protein